MLSFIPLDRGALERLAALLAWIMEWVNMSAEDDQEGWSKFRVLAPSNWARPHMPRGTYLWSPPPAAGEAMVDRLGKSLHKRPTSIHVVLIPRLMTYLWRKRLSKTCDFMVDLPVGPEQWNHSQHEPLVLAISLPLSKTSPWRYRGTTVVEQAEKPVLLGCGRMVTTISGLFCANSCERRGVFPACQGVWYEGCYKMDEGSDPFPVKRPVDEGGNDLTQEKDKARFSFARSGDHLMTRFQCDTCHFQNIRGRDILQGVGADKLLMMCVRRANLDALWSRESSTVENNRRQVGMLLRKGEMLDQLLAPSGPLPLMDAQGMSIACRFLLRTLDEGKIQNHVQFDTMRQMRNAVSNQWRTSVLSDNSMVMLRGTTKMIASKTPTNADWFKKFMVGVHKGMGDESCPDRAISMEAMLALMEIFEKDFGMAGDNVYTQSKAVFPALFALASFAGELRGEEVPLTDLHGLCKYYLEGILHPRHPHVVMALRGRFKNEYGELYHLMPLVPETTSGLKIKVWFEQMLNIYKALGLNAGSVFRNKQGKRGKASQYEYDILSRLVQVQRERPDLIPETVNVLEE
jgi:hypothetical protein